MCSGLDSKGGAAGSKLHDYTEEETTVSKDWERLGRQVDLVLPHLKSAGCVQRLAINPVV